MKCKVCDTVPPEGQAAMTFSPKLTQPLVIICAECEKKIVNAHNKNKLKAVE